MRDGGDANGAGYAGVGNDGWVNLVYGIAESGLTLTGDGDVASLRGCRDRCDRQTWP